MKTSNECLVLIRDPTRTREPEMRERSEVLFARIVEPAATENDLVCLRIDPTEFGPGDQRLFELLESASIVVVDAAAKSMDYAYSLGVRHALTDKPTFILAEMDHIP